MGLPPSQLGYTRVQNGSYTCLARGAAGSATYVGAEADVVSNLGILVGSVGGKVLAVEKDGKLREMRREGQLLLPPVSLSSMGHGGTELPPINSRN
jgi:hypothetical protein